MMNSDEDFTKEQKHAVEIVCTTIDTSVHAFKVRDEIKQILHNVSRDAIRAILDANPKFADKHRAGCVKEQNSDRGYYDSNPDTLARCKWLWGGKANDKCILKKLKNRSYTTSARQKQGEKQATAEKVQKSENVTNELSRLATSTVEWNNAALAKYRYDTRAKFGIQYEVPTPIVYATEAKRGTVITKLDIDGVVTSTLIPKGYAVRGFDDHIIVTDNEVKDMDDEEAANTMVFSTGIRGTPGTELFTNRRAHFVDVVVGGGYAYYLSVEKGIECSHVLSYCQGERGRDTTSMPMRSGSGTMLLTHDSNTLVYVCNMGVVLWVLCRFSEYRRVILADNGRKTPIDLSKKYGKKHSFAKPVSMEEGLPWGNPIVTTAIPATITSGDPDTLVLQEDGVISQMHVPFLGMGPLEDSVDATGTKTVLFETSAGNTLLSAGRNVVCTTMGIYTSTGAQPYTPVLQHVCTSSTIYNNKWMLCDADWYAIVGEGVIERAPSGPPAIKLEHAHKRSKR